MNTVTTNTLDDLINDLGDWGAATKAQIEREYPVAFRAATREGYLMQKRVSNFVVYVLSKKGRLKIGLTNIYVPSQSSLLSMLIMRFAIHELKEKGFGRPETYNNYGKGTIALMRGEDNQTIAIHARDSITRRSIYNIHKHFFGDGEDVSEIKPDRIFVFVMEAEEEVLKMKEDVKEEMRISLRYVGIQEMNALFK
ncbi:hypothetical protein [Deinococcus cellulosilyticus]|uniref:Uncharacterized protein n=1 Tax=Deinococcus cellulosilyticus (strain DSM 18568 / NBRC 106333 / KACC 11606 / 5516J-15) TaxID=1223518 RepID=A0A511NAH6_DEIC1|nr:hypothetical protein [Deinococcus cellulosilyticus]GEM49832.1 hypothetical protein DC3_54670 [Deinococcus cellulosilyticus NBRC 106333 = KACC 11606]